MVEPIKSKEEAFIPLPNEKNIPIHKDMHPFQFTRNWFKNRNQKTWSSFFPDFKDSLGGRPLNMIQIGVFEGMDLVWCCQNILDEDSEIIAIDPWKATRKIDQKGMDAVQQRARINLAPWMGNNFELFQGFSGDILESMKADDRWMGKFDLVVIDGDHKGPAVLADAVGSYPFLRKGGWMVFDDVRMRFDKPEEVPAGIESFLALSDEFPVELVWQHRYCDCYRKV